jgi:hypothetical protein
MKLVGQRATRLGVDGALSRSARQCAVWQADLHHLCGALRYAGGVP